MDDFSSTWRLGLSLYRSGLSACRTGAAHLVRELSHEAGLGVFEAMDQARMVLPEGARARVMARGFVRGLDEELEHSEAAQRARKIARTVGRDARVAVAVIGGCVAAGLGVALVLRIQRRR